MRSVSIFLEEELSLTISQEKTKVVYAGKDPFTFLGYELIEYIRRLGPKKEAKFKKRVKEITRRNQTVDIQTLIDEKLNL